MCKEISEITGREFKPSDDNCEIQSRPMGINGADVILCGSLYERIPFDFECKNCETISLPKWFEQAKANTKERRFPCIVFKKKSMGSKPFVALQWEAFKSLLFDHFHFASK